MEILPAAPPIARPDPSAATVALEVVRRASAIRPPAGLIRLEARLRSGQASTAELARLIDGSPALAARLLRIANSAFYSPRQPIVTLNRALVVIGDAVLGQMVIHAIVASRRAEGRTPTEALAGARLMSDGVRCAVTARALAQLGDAVGPDEAFAAGLLHDLGHVLLLDDSPAAYAGYLQGRPGPGDCLDVELEMTGTTHEAVGEAFAIEWNLPAPLRQAMARHHGPADSAISSVIRVADRLVGGRDRPAIAEAGSEPVDIEALLDAVGVTPGAWADRAAATNAEMAELLTIFDLAA